MSKWKIHSASVLLSGSNEDDFEKSPRNKGKEGKEITQIITKDELYIDKEKFRDYPKEPPKDLKPKIKPIALGSALEIKELERKPDTESEISLFCDLYWLELIKGSSFCETFFDFYRGEKHVASKTNLENAFINLKHFDEELNENSIQLAFQELLKDFTQNYMTREKEDSKFTILTDENYADYLSKEIVFIFILIKTRQGEIIGKQRLSLLLEKFEECKKEAKDHLDVFENLAENLSVLKIMAQKYSPLQARKYEDPYNLDMLLKQPPLICRETFENFQIHKDLSRINNALCLFSDENVFALGDSIIEWLKAPREGNKSVADFYKSGIFSDDPASLVDEKFKKQFRVFNTQVIIFLLHVLKKLHDFLEQNYKDSGEENIPRILELIKSLNEIFDYRRDLFVSDLDSYINFLALHFKYLKKCIECQFDSYSQSPFLDQKEGISQSVFRKKETICRQIAANHMLKVFNLLCISKKRGYKARTYRTHLEMLEKLFVEYNLDKFSPKELLDVYPILCKVLLDADTLKRNNTQTYLFNKICEALPQYDILNKDFKNSEQNIIKQVDRLKWFYDIVINDFGTKHNQLDFFVKDIIQRLNEILEQSNLLTPKFKNYCQKRAKDFDSLRKGNKKVNNFVADDGAFELQLKKEVNIEKMPERRAENQADKIGEGPALVIQEAEEND